MSNIELPVGKHAVDGKKRLRRVVPLITTAAISASLIVAAVAPASAAVRPSAPISVSGNGRTAVALRAALDRFRWTGDGQFALVSAGLSSWARSADSDFVADLNEIERQAGALDLASDKVVDAAAAVAAADRAPP